MMEVNPQVILEEEQGEAILFDPESLMTAWLNETGILVWKSFREGLDENSICERLCDRYECEKRNEVFSDIQELITQFKEAGFILEKESS